MVLQLFPFHFTPQRAWITTSPPCTIYKSTFFPFFSLFLISHVTSYHPVCLSLYSPLPLLTLLTSDILSVPLGLTIGNTVSLASTYCCLFFFLVLSPHWNLAQFQRMRTCVSMLHQQSALLGIVSDGNRGLKFFDLEHLSCHYQGCPALKQKDCWNKSSWGA